MKFDYLDQKLVEYGLGRKFDKLKRDPNLFIRDLIEKRKVDFFKYIPVKYNGKNSFTIISAIYNVEKYLKQYFESIVNQSLSFKKNIYIVCVDDGSTDNSAKIIKKWQRKYPRNIKYIYKENGGQASARNLGLKNISTEWVTFIDPDDFISKNYLRKMDEYLTENRVEFVSLPMAVYNESTNVYKYDGMPLSYCYNKGSAQIDVGDMSDIIQLSVCNAIFNYNIIKFNNIEFNCNIKPNFEDGRFVLDYFSYVKKVAYLNGEYYYYRVREDNSSTTNKQWEKAEKYNDVLQHGFLELFELNENKEIPVNIQRTFLYFAIQYIKRITDDSSLLDFLSVEEKARFKKLFFNCFEYIDARTIMGFHLHNCSYEYKLGMIEGIKKDKSSLSIVTVDKIDYANNRVVLKYFSSTEDFINIYIDGNLIIPSTLKKKIKYFVDEVYYIENRVSFGFSGDFDKIKIEHADKKVLIRYGSSEFVGEISNNNLELKVCNLKSDIWLFIDKDYKADDNAEHFYRFVKNKKLKEKIYFALNKNSQDWNRLESEGFNLVDFGSKEFDLVFSKSEILLSSHADKYFLEYSGKGKEKKFVFLQHGVIATDISLWLNGLKHIDVFVTSTKDEYEFISGEYSPYIYDKVNTKLTGLPRHDLLLEKSKTWLVENEILVIPTWRSTVVGSLKHGSSRRELNSDFIESSYFKYWKSFFHSPILKEMINKHKYSVKFIPHPNILDYIPLFDLPDYIITVLSGESFSYQEAFLSAKILITDYSSVAFDMAYLNKMTLYYLFDFCDDQKGHSSKKGNFDYYLDGFGPTASNEVDLFKELDVVLENDCKPFGDYKSRIKDVFPFRDGGNCERVFNEITNKNNVVDNKILIEKYIEYSESQGDINVLKTLYFIVLSSGVSRYSQLYKDKYLNILLELNDVNSIELICGDSENNDDYFFILQILKCNWSLVVKLLGKNKYLSPFQSVIILYAYYRLGMYSDFNKVHTKYFRKLDSEIGKITLVFKFMILKDWSNVSKYVSELLDSRLKNTIYSIKCNMFFLLFKLELFFAVALRELGDISAASKLIHGFQSMNNDPLFLLEKTKIHIAMNNTKPALYWFGKLYGLYDIKYFDEESLLNYLRCMSEFNMNSEIVNLTKKLINLDQSKIVFVNYYICALDALKRWTDILSFCTENSIEISKSNVCSVVKSYYRSGFIDDAYETIIKPCYGDEYGYWVLVMEIALQVDDVELATYCHKNTLAIFPLSIKNTNDLYFEFTRKRKMLDVF